jgi:hypothetical protein
MSLLPRMIRVVVLRVLLGLVLVLCVTFIVDFLQLKYRIWRNHQPYGTVTVQIMYAISEKAPRGAQKTEYEMGGSQDQTCVNALFPQLGYSPCWYLRRNTQKQVNM